MMGKLIVEFRGKPDFQDDAALNHYLAVLAQKFGYKFYSAVSAPKQEDDRVVFVKDGKCTRRE